jgi:Caspase domain
MPSGFERGTASMKTLGLCTLLLACLAAAAPAAAQKTRVHEVGARAFAFHDKAPHTVVSSEPSAEARQIVERIMGAIGLAANFEVRAAPDVANAQAMLENGGKDRFILYNPAWMGGLKATVGDSWPEIGVLAHEIGHHLQFHLDPDFGNHAAELQADYFSGFVMHKLGASLAQAQLAMAMIGAEEATETHPARARRVQEIARGWQAAAANRGANVIDASLAAPPKTSAAPAETRVALLIGNSNYRSWGKLKNPKNDVVAIQRELRRLGFSTTTLYDGTAEQIAQYLRLFREDARQADWAMFYFAGSGVEIDGVNYMVPVDAEAGRATLFARDYPQMRLELAFEAVRSAKTVRLVVADACRIDPANLPNASNRPTTAARILKVLEPPGGVLVAYSTGSGQYAGDGDGDLSPYAQAMIAALRDPGIELDKVFRRVGADVAAVTRGNQVPTVLGNWPARDLYLTGR